jgi:hypothetical protein
LGELEFRRARFQSSFLLTVRPMKLLCGIFILLSVALATPACSSLDSELDTSSRARQPVPGEVNPDAPDASQNLRTSPGVNF